MKLFVCVCVFQRKALNLLACVEYENQNRIINLEQAELLPSVTSLSSTVRVFPWTLELRRLASYILLVGPPKPWNRSNGTNQTMRCRGPPGRGLSSRLTTYPRKTSSLTETATQHAINYSWAKHEYLRDVIIHWRHQHLAASLRWKICWCSNTGPL